MGVRKWVNNFSTTISSSIITTDTSIPMTIVTGLPTLTGGDWIIMTLDDGAGNYEEIKVTNTSNPMTAVRAQEGSTAQNFASGVKIEVRLTAAGMDSKLDVSAYTPGFSPDSLIGTENVIGGSGSGHSLTGGTGNTFFGYHSGYALTSASYITAIGDTACSSITTGSANYAVGVGYGALAGVTSGTYNTAVGTFAGTSLNSASDCTIIGALACVGSTGQGLTAIGARAMANGTGGRANIIAIGEDSNQYGSGNGTVNIGSSLCGRQNGASCVAVGLSSGRDCTGDNNVWIGANSGYGDSSGSNNILIGYNTTKSAGTVSNEATIGNSSIATLRCQQTSITALSDRRDKKDIQDLTLGLNFVENLKPVKFTWAMRDGNPRNDSEAGFIAQDLLQNSKDFNCEWANLVLTNNPERLEASPGKLIPILVKAIQELSAKVKELENAAK